MKTWSHAGREITCLTTHLQEEAALPTTQCGQPKMGVLCFLKVTLDCQMDECIYYVCTKWTCNLSERKQLNWLVHKIRWDENSYVGWEGELYLIYVEILKRFEMVCQHDTLMVSWYWKRCTGGGCYLGQSPKNYRILCPLHSEEVWG
jgi:hypothetical protein